MDIIIQEYLHDILGLQFTWTPVSGGDISQAYKVSANGATFFLKTNTSHHAYDMFSSEALCLNRIADSGIIKTPQVIHIGKHSGSSLLLLEYIESKSPNAEDIFRFGKTLAQWHKSSQHHQFGWEQDNWIGSLRQPNSYYSTWSKFYTHNRLMPQFNLAVRSGFGLLTKYLEPHLWINTIEIICGNIQPQTVHGDLWGGNYLISTTGEPYLIDPAIYFGHGEVDIAMSTLFGGFNNSFYRAYRQQVPEPPDFKRITALYQLYFLLVHLNLFGNSYLSPVLSKLKVIF